MLTLKRNLLKKTSALLGIILLASCAGNQPLKPAAAPTVAQAPTKKPQVTPPQGVSPSNTQAGTAKTEPAAEAKPGSGGYYLDDGPGENAPADIDNIPSAPLKTEPLNSRANKPYVALGQQYTPMTSYVPYKKQGMASWYGKRFHGKKTSTGEIYDMYAMSAAHTTLPIPSYAKVTNPANGRSVVVRINDRGPFKHSRIIDLSYAAAHQLRLVKQGSGLVEVETIDTSAEAMKKNPAKLASAKPLDSTSIDSTPAPTSTAATNSSSDVQITTVTPSAETKPIDSPTANNNIVSQASAPLPTPSTSAQYFVQAGAFKNEANGTLLQKKIQGLDLLESVNIANVYNNGLYRVKLGPYTSKQGADTSAAKIRSKLNIATLITNQ